MKCKNVFLTLAVALLAFSSCKKENQSPPQTTPGKKKITSSTMSGGVTSFQYNPDGSIKSFKNVNNGVEYAYTFQYNSNTAMVLCVKDGVKVSETSFELNAKKWATKRTTVFYKPDGTVYYSVGETFFYSPDDKLIKRVYSDGEYDELHYDGAGNLSERRFYKADGTNDFKVVYEYYTDKENKFYQYGPQSTEFHDIFFPARATHMMKRFVGMEVPTDIVAYEQAYTYEYDADGYAVKGTEVALPGNTTKTRTNTFQ